MGYFRFLPAPPGNTYELSTCISGGGVVSLRQHSRPISALLKRYRGIWQPKPQYIHENPFSFQIKMAGSPPRPP